MPLLPLPTVLSGKIHLLQRHLSYEGESTFYPHKQSRINAHGELPQQLALFIGAFDVVSQIS